MQSQWPPIALKVPRVLAPRDRIRSHSVYQGYEGVISFCLLWCFSSHWLVFPWYFSYFSSILCCYHGWDSRDTVKSKVVSVHNKTSNYCLIFMITFSKTEKQNQIWSSLCVLIPSTKPNQTASSSLFPNASAWHVKTFLQAGLFDNSFHPVPFALLHHFQFLHRACTSKCTFPRLFLM